MPTLLLARHGQASYGGADYDVLSARGHEQAAMLTDELQRRGVRVDRVLAGTMRRQRDTAAPVAETFGVPVEIEPRLNEYDTSDVLAAYSDSSARADGLDTPTISSTEFQQVLDPALSAWIDASAGGEAKESWAQFSRRSMDSVSEFADALRPGSTGLAATSGGVIAAVCVNVLGLPAQSFMAFNRVAVNGGLTTLVIGRRGTSLISYNEHGHLQSRQGSLVTYR